MPTFTTAASPRPTSSGGSGGGFSGGGGGGGSRRLRDGGSVSYTATEWRTVEPLATNAETIAVRYPERRDLFLCHAWDDRESAALDLYHRLTAHGASVWFSEYDLGLGKSLMQEIDKGLRNSRIGIVLVTPPMLRGLEGRTGIGSNELSALLTTDRVIPVAHDTDFDALRDISPLLAARSGLTTGPELTMDDVAKKVAAAAAAVADPSA